MTFAFKPSGWNFSGVIILYLVTYTFHAVYQATMLSLVSIYEYRWTKYYYTFLPISHVFIVTLKAISVEILNLGNLQDFIFLWSSFVILIIILLTLLTKLSKTAYFKSRLTRPESENHLQSAKKVNYKAAFEVVKDKSIGLFFTYVLYQTSYPGIVFSSHVSSIFRISIDKN